MDSPLGVIVYIVILLGVIGLLYMMYVIIRLSYDDDPENAGRNSQLKEMVQTLFGTPAFLRQSEQSATDEEAAASSADLQPFTESCPACGEQVTEKHPTCPSCGLRLL